MKEEYTNILDEMVKNDKLIKYIDGRNLLSYLQVQDVINFQEREKSYLLGQTECTQYLIEVVLKSRKDECMTHFLNSLQYAKYDDAFCWLTEKLKSRSLKNDHQHVPIFDEKRSVHQFIWFEVRDPTINFIGREVQLKELHNKMQNDIGADAKKIVIITGLGGIGKTQLALTYVRLYSQHYDNNIIWINAESDATLRSSLLHLAKTLNINVKHANRFEKETLEILKDVYTHFSMVKCLFVFNNADEPLKDDFYPSSQSGIFILITSRYQKWGQINVFHLDIFSPAEASDFIRITLKIRTDLREDQITDLAKTLHFFPLALKQATAYINETSKIKENIGTAYSVEDYIKEYNERKEKLLNYKFVSDYGNACFQTTFTTWKITIDRLQGRTGDNNSVQKIMKRFSLYKSKMAENVAISILDCISYLAHEKIDMQIFVKQENNEEIGFAIRSLQEYSLITEENGLLNIHPLVQEMTRLNIKQKRSEKETFITVCELLETYLAKLIQSQDHYKLKIVLSHSEKLLQEIENWLIKNPSQRKHIEQESIKNLLIQMSIAYFSVGQPSLNKKVIIQLLAIKIEQYGQDHYEVALTLRDLGNAYGALGQPVQQISLLEKALVIKEKQQQTAATLIDVTPNFFF